MSDYAPFGPGHKYAIDVHTSNPGDRPAGYRAILSPANVEERLTEIEADKFLWWQFVNDMLDLM